VSIHGVAAGSTNVYGQIRSQCDAQGDICTFTAQAQANVQCAVPTNFRLSTSYPTTFPAGSTPAGNSLYTQYLWDSTSGMLSDLAACSVREWTSFPGGNPYTFPTPFPALTQSNPYDGGGPQNYVAGSDGGLGDIHSPWGGTQLSFRTPYFANSFTATEVYQYSCPCHNSGNRSSSAKVGNLANRPGTGPTGDEVLCRREDGQYG
jgi:hypothetical protein